MAPRPAGPAGRTVQAGPLCRRAGAGKEGLSRRALGQGGYHRAGPGQGDKARSRQARHGGLVGEGGAPGLAWAGRAGWSLRRGGGGWTGVSTLLFFLQPCPTAPALLACVAGPVKCPHSPLCAVCPQSRFVSANSGSIVLEMTVLVPVSHPLPYWENSQTRPHCDDPVKHPFAYFGVLADLTYHEDPCTAHDIRSHTPTRPEGNAIMQYLWLQVA